MTQLNYENPQVPEQEVPQEVTPEPSKQVQEVNETPQSTEQSFEDIINMSDDQFDKLNPSEFGFKESNEGLVDTGTNPAEANNQATQEVTETQTQTQEEPKQDGINFEDFYRQVTGEFKANGMTMQLTDANDIIRAMQMGMNYQKKMQAIKPHLRTLKTLEQHGMLGEDKVKFAIDLLRHDPSAISQLLKESNVDTYDLPDVEENPYQSNTTMVDEHQLKFNDTIEELGGYSHGKDILNQVQSWDDKSTTELYEKPHLLITLAEQAETGLYQDTMSIIARDKALGKIPDSMTDIDAYDYVASTLLANDAQGRYKRNVTTPSHQPQFQQVVGNNIRQGVQPAVRTAPVGSNITKGATSNPVNTRINVLDILNMSDEDFSNFGSYEDMLKKFKS